MVAIRRDTELEDRILEMMFEMRNKEKDIANIRREVAHLMHDLGAVYLEPSEEEEQEVHHGRVTFRQAVEETVQHTPGLAPAQIWEEVKQMGVRTRNSRPNKAVSMTLHDLKVAGKVVNHEDGWYPVDRAA